MKCAMLGSVVLLLGAAAAGAQPALEKLRPTYVLGPGDAVVIRSFAVPEIGDKPYRIKSDGLIDLPLVGAVQAGGRTLEELEAELKSRLQSLVRDPQVNVAVVEFRAEPVFVSGAVKAPGIYPLQGRKTLLEILTGVGGLLPNASRRIKLTRRPELGPIPHPAAIMDPDTNTSSLEITLDSLRESTSLAEDIVLEPFDLISVERAEMVYVSGEVGKVGGIELGERSSISVIQVLSLAGGLGRDAAPEKARILRPVMNTSRRAEIPVNLRKVLEGKQRDYPLEPNDLLYVPRSSRRVLWGRVALIAVPLFPTVIYLLLR